MIRTLLIRSNVVRNQIRTPRDIESAIAASRVDSAADGFKIDVTRCRVSEIGNARGREKQRAEKQRAEKQKQRSRNRDAETRESYHREAYTREAEAEKQGCREAETPRSREAGQQGSREAWGSRGAVEQRSRGA